MISLQQLFRVVSRLNQETSFGYDRSYPPVCGNQISYNSSKCLAQDPTTPPHADKFIECSSPDSNDLAIPISDISPSIYSLSTTSRSGTSAMSVKSESTEFLSGDSDFLRNTTPTPETEFVDQKDRYFQTGSDKCDILSSSVPRHTQIQDASSLTARVHEGILSLLAVAEAKISHNPLCETTSHIKSKDNIDSADVFKNGYKRNLYKLPNIDFNCVNTNIDDELDGIANKVIGDDMRITQDICNKNMNTTDSHIHEAACSDIASICPNQNNLNEQMENLLEQYYANINLQNKCEEYVSKDASYMPQNLCNISYVDATKLDMLLNTPFFPVMNSSSQNENYSLNNNQNVSDIVDFARSLCISLAKLENKNNSNDTDNSNTCGSSYQSALFRDQRAKENTLPIKHQGSDFCRENIKYNILENNQNQLSNICDIYPSIEWSDLDKNDNNIRLRYSKRRKCRSTKNVCRDTIINFLHSATNEITTGKVNKRKGKCQNITGRRKRRCMHQPTQANIFTGKDESCMYKNNNMSHIADDINEKNNETVAASLTTVDNINVDNDGEVNSNKNIIMNNTEGDDCEEINNNVEKCYLSEENISNNKKEGIKLSNSVNINKDSNNDSIFKRQIYKDDKEKPYKACTPGSRPKGRPPLDSDSKSRHPGVCFSASKDVWRARITVDGRQYEQQLSVKRHGYYGAKLLAIQWRLGMERLRANKNGLTSSLAENN